MLNFFFFFLAILNNAALNISEQNYFGGHLSFYLISNRLSGLLSTFIRKVVLIYAPTVLTHSTGSYP